MRVDKSRELTRKSRKRQKRHHPSSSQDQVPKTNMHRKEKRDGMPDRRFRCEEEYFKLCTLPYLTSILPRASLIIIIIITLLSLSLSLNTTLPYSLSPNHPFQPPPSHRPPTNKTKQNKTKQTKRNLPPT